MKRVLLGLCCVLMLLSGAVPAAADYYDQAAGNAEVFVDTAGLLDDDEAESIVIMTSLRICQIRLT